MLDINFFGYSYVIDKESGIVLYIHASNEIAKFVTSSILDSYTLQLSRHRTKDMDPSWFMNDKWIQVDHRINFSLYTGVINPTMVYKKDIAILRARGYYMLLEQATIMECSYDNLSDLSSTNLPMYLLNKEKYISEYSLHKNVSIDISRKHLEFLSDSLISEHFRKQTLLWKYGSALKSVNTPDEYKKWETSVLLETLGSSRVWK